MIKSSEFDLMDFWRVDKDRYPEMRHTVLTLAAFHDLKWMISAQGGNRDGFIRKTTPMAKDYSQEKYNDDHDRN